ncbi:hypothetical protein DXG03_009440 [Asterophora parasitica]|uniref:Uncharacterized protein n=1 Tax=Asterophora parasitica TaxID=117018 RepID=A0A9P7KEE7_9AGAR|nr:hypothetical protein DXG03_009440 [Asterophora parasitica]
MDNYWFSHNSFTGPGKTSGNSFLISVVLEEAAASHFEGIRVVIIYESSDELDSLNITECRDPRMFGLSMDNQASYRGNLMSRSLATRRNKGSPSGVLCTVVLEVVDLSDERTNNFTLSPRSLSELHRPRDFRVAYDSTYYCRSSSPSLLLLLNTSHPLCKIPVLANFSLDLAEHQMLGVFVHSVRVSPVTRTRRLPDLPPPILLEITRLAIGTKGPGWRKTLLSYGLVCKSWTCVLDLSIGGFDREADGDKPGVIPIARAIGRRPERATCIRTFSPTTYETLIDSHRPETLPKWRAILTILTHAIAVETLRFGPVHTSIVSSFLEVLHQLRSVRLLKLGFPELRRNNKFNRGHILTMSDVQRAISKWEQLETLEISYWRKDTVDALSIPSELTCSIRRLKLEGGALSGRQLMLFTPRSTPSLQELNLREVSGITNKEFFNLLLAVAPTLSILYTVKCDFAWDSDDHEYAIDAALPMMVSLQRLTARGNCSLLAIARKPSRYDSQGAEALHGEIFIVNAEQCTADDLAKAMQHTMWGVVRIDVVRMAGWNAGLESMVIEAAKKRGVDFMRA